MSKIEFDKGMPPRPETEEARQQRLAAERDCMELKQRVQEGIDSGPGLDASEVFARLRARFGEPRAR